MGDESDTPSGALPKGSGRPPSVAEAAAYLSAAGGDRVKAKAAMKQNNWKVD